MASAARHSNGDNDSIMDLKAGRMTLIDHKKKEYSEFTLEEMAAFMNDMEKQMQGNPIMEKLMGGALGEVSVKKGATPRKIAGYTCDEYIMSMGENMTWEMWTTPDVQPPMQYFDAYKAQFSSMGPMAKRMEKMVDEMRKLKGFPLATTMHMKMMMASVDTTTEATEVKKGPVAASVFEVPKDYKKKDAPFKAMKH